MSDLKTLIHMIDVRQSDDKNDKAQRCGVDASHGRMVVRADGSTLLCRCGYSEPVD